MITTMVDQEIATATAHGHLYAWRVFGFGYLFGDRPQPYWETATRAGPGLDDQFSILIGSIPERLLGAVRDWRSQIPLLLRAQLGEQGASSPEQLDAELQEYREAVDVSDIEGGYSIWLTLELRRPLQVESKLGRQIAWLGSDVMGECETFGAAANEYLDGILPALLGPLGRFSPSKALFTDRRSYLVVPGKPALTVPRFKLSVADWGVTVDVVEGWAGMPTDAITAVVGKFPSGSSQVGRDFRVAGRWLTAALEEHDDLLRRFSFAFFGIEVLTSKLAKRISEKLLMELSTELEGLPLNELVRPSTGDDRPWRNLVFRFSCVAIYLTRETAAEDLKLFKRLAKARNDLAHGAVDNLEELPAHEGVALLQRYLTLAAAADVATPSLTSSSETTGEEQVPGDCPPRS